MDISDLLSKAVLIGDNFIKESKRGNFGDDLLNIANNQGKVNYLKYSMYDGLSGLILFFSKLYRCTNESKYLEFAVNAANCVVNKQNSNFSNNESIYFGYYGFVYTLKELAKEPIHDSLRNEIDIICKNGYHKTHNNNDTKNLSLISGLCGQVIGNRLIRNHVDINKDLVDHKFESDLARLLSEIIVDDKGVYFKDNLGFSKREFSLGYGVGLTGTINTFIELYRYFGNGAYLELAKDIIEFQNTFYNKNCENWTHFNFPIRNNLQLIDLARNSLTKSKTPLRSNYLPIGWYYGVSGLLLSRVKMYSFSKEEKYQKDITRCLNIIKKSLNNCNDTSISHGLSGTGLALLASYYTTGDLKYYDQAIKVTEKVIEIESDEFNLEDNKSNISLFQGKLGVGYLYLQFIRSQEESIIDFRLNSEKKYDKELYFKYDYTDLLKKGLIKKFPKTVICLDKQLLIDNHLITDLSSFEKIISTSSSKIRKTFREENQRNKFYETVHNRISLLVREVVGKELNFLALNSEIKFEDLTFVTSPDVLVTKMDQKYQLYCRGYSFGYDLELNELSYFLLRQFKKMKKVSKIDYSLLGAEGPIPMKFMKVIHSQIRKLIEAGYLVCQDKRVMKKFLHPLILILIGFTISCSSNEKDKVEEKSMIIEKKSIPSNPSIKVSPNSAKFVSKKNITFSIDTKHVNRCDFKALKISDNEGSVLLEDKFDCAPDSVSIINGIEGVGKKNLIIEFAKKNGEPVVSRVSIELLSNIIPKSKIPLIIREFFHDKNSFTQGLLFYEGLVYEGTGRNGNSCIKIYRLNERSVISESCLPDEFFGEGIAILNNKLYQLTWKSNVAFSYDAKTLEKLNKFYFSTEGWGLTDDGLNLILSDGSNRIYRYTENFELIDFVDVYDNYGPVTNINELEFIDGLLYANIWQTNKIAVIDVGTGKVIEWINLANLLKTEHIRKEEIDVLNGIAYNKETKTVFVTGKMWPILFEVRFFDEKH